MVPEVEPIRQFYLRELRAPFFVAIVLPTLPGTAIALPEVEGIRALPLHLFLAQLAAQGEGRSAVHGAPVPGDHAPRLSLPPGLGGGGSGPALTAGGPAGAPLAWKCCRWISRDEIPLAQRG
ncbi:MAG: hypothetical protein ACLFPN_05820, partial [Methanomassiliicoccales archaeon]